MMRRTRRDDSELDPVRRRIVGLLKESRSSLRMASLAMGRNGAYMHQFIHRGTPRVLGEHDREALAEHVGCSPDLFRHPREMGAHLKAPAASRVVPRGYTAVPEIDVRAAAGIGMWDDEPRAVARWLFADPVVRHEFRARAEDLRMLAVEGDSMEPLLSAGDRVLVDVSRTAPTPPGVFAIWDGMGCVAKRVEHVPNSDPPRVLIKSVNPEYESYERVVDEIRVIGRVVWASRRM